MTSTNRGFEKVRPEPSGSDSMAAGSRRGELITSFLRSQESKAEGRERFTHSSAKLAGQRVRAPCTQLDQAPPSLPPPPLLKTGAGAGGTLKG